MKLSAFDNNRKGKKLFCNMPTRQKGEVEWKKESGGTRQRTGGEVKGKEANGVGSLQSSA